MKKLLNKITVFTIITSTSSFIVACNDKDRTSKNEAFRSEPSLVPEPSSEPKPIALNEALSKIKNYINNELHYAGKIDAYTNIGLYPDRQFFTNQHYKDVVDILNKYVKLRCKKENLDLVKVELNEQDAPLDEGQNVIKIKLTLNDQSVETTANLDHVKKPNIEEQKANLLATKLMNETHNFTYNEFTESNTVNDVANKIKQIYQQDLVVGYFDNIVFDQDDATILPSTKLKWGENIIPLIVRYNSKPNKVNLKINLMNQQQFSEYEVNQVIDEVIFENESEILKSVIQFNDNDTILIYTNFYRAIANKINDFLASKETEVKVRSVLPDPIQIESKLLPLKISFKAYLKDFEKEFELTINKKN